MELCRSRTWEGAADGVGATFKRTAPVVGSGQDVSNFKQFVQLVSERIKGIQIKVIPSAKDDNLAAEVKENSKPVKGKNYIT